MKLLFHIFADEYIRDIILSSAICVHVINDNWNTLADLMRGRNLINKLYENIVNVI